MKWFNTPMDKISFLPLLVMLNSCDHYGQLTVLAKLPKSLEECSGMVSVQDAVWVVEDSGNPDEIYKVDYQGKLIRTLKVKNAKNTDWEDLARGENGALYIGDFGNNTSDRKDLVIYKLPDPDIEPGNKIEAQKIHFRYPEQNKFPPKKARRFYDAEAFFYFQGWLYIITKNRAHPFPGTARIYKVPAQKGHYEATLITDFPTCPEWATCQITSADISPDGKTIVLLSYGKLWKITDFTMDDFSKGAFTELDLELRTQLESVCFADNNTLLLADERKRGTGRNLYIFPLEQP
ncbi:MAG: hypothetical protein AAGA86_13695 [Bacteroidota bacterium]